MYKLAFVMQLSFLSIIPGTLYAQAEAGESGMNKVDVLVIQTSCTELQLILKSYDELALTTTPTAKLFEIQARTVRDAIRKLKVTDPEMWRKKQSALSPQGKCE